MNRPAAWLGGALIGSTVFLRGWIPPLVIAIVAFTLCGLALLREQGRLPAEIMGFRFLMDILDRLTDKQKFLQAIATVTPQAKREIDRAEVGAFMKSKILGYDEIIDGIVRQVWAGYKAVKRETPIGVFMLVGPPSTGKTHFGKVLGTALFGSQGSYVEDLSSFSGDGSASAITGSSPGYSGSTQSSGLVTYLRAHPAAVVVLDEFEKAHRSVQRAFLSAWNEGFMTDLTTQEKVSTVNAVFVVTSNAAGDAIAELATTFSGSQDELSDRCKTLLKRDMESSILSRINYVFPLTPLQGPDLGRLLGLLIERELEKYGLQAAAGAVSFQTLLAYYKESVQRGVDARAMRAKIGRDIAEQAAELQGIEPPLVSVFERDGQVFVVPFRDQAGKPPARAKPAPEAEAPAAKGRPRAKPAGDPPSHVP